MPQIFHRATNSLSKASIFGGIFILAGLIYLADQLYNSSYVNEQLVIREQPVPFSHKHHVAQLGIDCRYCHTSAETSSFAGIPPTETCMTCHSQIWTNADMLKPVRDAYESGQPIKWVRVNWLPHYVYFDHSIHVNKGVACVTCHGSVDQMPLSWRQSTLQMRWCLSCHEHPETGIGPKDAVFRTGELPASERNQRAELAQKYHVKKISDCAACHR